MITYRKYTFISILALGGVSISCSAKMDPQNSLSESIKKETIESMLKIDGGSFKMGDFGKILPETERLYYSMDNDNKPLHTVTVNSFFIQKYRVTNKNYDDYLIITGKKDKSYHYFPNKNNHNISNTDLTTRWPDEAVTVDWNEAHDYCEWLGQHIGMEGNLPTEAQWEYVARSKGKFILLATDNGKAESGRNVPTIEQIIEMHPENANNGAIRVGHFPPNSIGIYDLGYGGLEWMQDWYDPNYYKYSPILNPKGPESGKEKSQRGARSNEDGYALTSAQLTFKRYHNTPDLYSEKYHKTFFTPGNGMRCVFTPKQ